MKHRGVFWARDINAFPVCLFAPAIGVQFSEIHCFTCVLLAYYITIVLQRFWLLFTARVQASEGRLDSGEVTGQIEVAAEKKS